MAKMYNRADNGYLGETPTKPLQKFIVEDDRVHEIHNIVVHKFRMSDVEDPEIYAAEPIWKWQQTEQGKWVMEHAMEPPVWHRYIEAVSYSQQYAITAKLKGVDHTFYMLKWGQTV
jgi:hypothetical protein